MVDIAKVNLYGQQMGSVRWDNQNGKLENYGVKIGG